MGNPTVNVSKEIAEKQEFISKFTLWDIINTELTSETFTSHLNRFDNVKWTLYTLYVWTLQQKSVEHFHFSNHIYIVRFHHCPFYFSKIEQEMSVYDLICRFFSVFFSGNVGLRSNITLNVFLLTQKDFNHVFSGHCFFFWKSVSFVF